MADRTKQLASTDGTMALERYDVTMGGTMHRTAHQRYLDDHLKCMHEDIENMTKRLELEKRRLNKLEQDCKRARQEHSEKVLKIKPKEKVSKGEDGQQKEQHHHHRDHKAQAEVIPIRKMEHRKMKLVSDLDALENENKVIRNKIDSTRRERLQMNQIFKKLQSDIKENIVHVTRLQKDTDAAKHEQEEKQNRVLALKKLLDRERKNFKGQVGEYQKQLEENKQSELRDKVDILKDEAKQRGEDPSRKHASLMADEEEQFKSQVVMGRILKLAFLNAIQRRHIKKHQKAIEVFEQAFQTIKSTTGISDIEEIVKIFVALEQRNFSLLTYVNMLNREIETFEKSNRELEEQLLSGRRHEEHSHKTKTEALCDKQKQIENTKKLTKENLDLASQQVRIIDGCAPRILGILRTVEKENKGFGGASAPGAPDWQHAAPTEGLPTGENILQWLTYIEKTLTQWKDFLPEKDTSSRHSNAQRAKNYKYTVGNQVLQLQPKKHTQTSEKLVRGSDLPVANLDAGGQQRGMQGREEDNSDEEEDLENNIFTWNDLRDKALNSLAKRKGRRKPEHSGQQQVIAAPEQGKLADAEAPAPAAELGAGELGYEDLVAVKEKQDENSDMDSDSDMDDDIGPTDEEINEIFLKRYKMSKEELQGMADKMRIQLNNLCYLKQEFDNYDEDRSGYIDVKELKGLLQKLGEELSDEELDQAFRELDSDGSGEIEFFEFVEWFTSED
jgi:hypothetical protein